MAKKGNRERIIIKSTKSGHMYHTSKNKVNSKDKLELKKYDPFEKAHVVYKEKK